MIKIKILGERSTGTNLLEKMLTHNFHCVSFPSSSGVLPHQRPTIPRRFESRWASRRASKEAIQDHNHHLELPEIGGWKHAAATQRFLEGFARPKSAVIICILRHPTEWLRSMHRNPFHGIAHVPRKFSDFINSPWIAASRDELGERLISSPLAMFEKKVESYVRLKEQHPQTYLVRYEDIVLHPNDTLSQLPIWEARKSESIDLPSQNARSFGRGRLDGSRYAQKASASSYDTLSDGDRQCVLDQLHGGRLLDFYSR